MRKYIISIIILFSILWAQEPLAEKIERLSKGLLIGYTQPLVTAFGTGISTGLFHSAYSHDFLGFDLGVRLMYIRIPNTARFFKGKAVVYSLAGDTLVCDSVELDSISTIFGPKQHTTVTTRKNAIGIPPSIPGGFDLAYVPLVLPQLNVGLFRGSELAIRYIPSTFKGSKVRFLGLGFKQELTRLLGLKSVPVAIAIGGAYQAFGVKDSLGNQIVNARTWNLQFIISKRIAVFEPFIGTGFEGTKVSFPYEFTYEILDTTGVIPTDLIQVIEDINVELHSQNEYRAMAGFTLRIGFFYIHYDYNILPYATHNAIFGLSYR